MPEWMRSFQAGMAQPPAGAAPSPFAPQAPQMPAVWPAAGAPGPGFAAGSLVSDDALPDWLRGAVPAAPANAPQQAPGWPAHSAGGAGWGAPAMNADPRAGAAYPQQGYAPQPPAVQSQRPQPRVPAGGNVGVAANMLFDESALPDWLRQPGGAIEAQPTMQHVPSVQPQPATMRAPLGQPAATAPYGGYAQPSAQGFAGPAQPSAASAFPSLDSVGALPPGAAPQTGLSAAALIDGGALPAWLGGAPGAPVPNAGVPGRPGGSGMSAQSLVDESSLPDWLRAQPATPQAPVQQASAWQNPTPAQAAPAPSWMQPQGMLGAPASVPQQPHPFAVQAPQPLPSSYASPATSGARAGGLSAGDFVDEGALPSWLRSHSGMPGPAAGQAAPPGPSAAGPTRPASSRGPGSQPGQAGMMPVYGGPPTQQGAARFSASDLIDPQALPGWARGQAGGEDHAGQSFSSTAGWTSQQATAAHAPRPMPDPREAPIDFGWGASGEQGYGAAEASVYEGADEWGLQQPEETPPSRPGAGLAGKAPRGRPIAEHELPPWLQGTGEPAPAARQGARGGMAPARGGEAYADYGFAEQQGYDVDGYAAAEYAEGYQGDFQGEYPEQFGDAAGPYGDGYDPRFADPYAEQGYDDAGWGEAEYNDAGGGEKRGWRKLFGRK